MVSFDRTHTFVLHAFLDEVGANKDAVAAFADVLNEHILKGTPSTSRLEYRGTAEVAYVTGGPSFSAIAWQSRGQICTAAVADARASLTFDTLAFSELKGVNRLGAEQLAEQFAPGFAAAVSTLGQRVPRLAFIASAMSTVTDRDQLQLKVAQRFLNQDSIAKAQRDAFQDMTIRLNTRDQWSLDGTENKATINQLETVGIDWQLANKKSEMVFKWQLDINTDPLALESNYTEESAIRFYNLAASAISEKYKDVSSLMASR